MAFKSGASAMAGFTFVTAGLNEMLPTSFKFWGSSSKEEKVPDQQPQKAPTPVPTAQPKPLVTTSIRFIGGVACLPHDDKVAKGGEDAWTASERLIAVADGVGGWARHGVDPGIFSKQLCKDIQKLFNEHGTKKSLKDILVDAVKLNKNRGSSTAVLASLEEPNIMKTTNLGDSGYTIYRAEKADDDKVVLKMTFRS